MINKDELDRYKAVKAKYYEIEEELSELSDLVSDEVIRIRDIVNKIFDKIFPENDYHFFCISGIGNDGTFCITIEDENNNYDKLYDIHLSIDAYTDGNSDLSVTWDDQRIHNVILEKLNDCKTKEDERRANLKKYELTDKTMEFEGHTLYRIRALKNFGKVKAGDLGGWIESEENLSQDGDCWVYDEAKVYGKAHVFEDAKVFGIARVYENAKVYGNAQVFGSTWVHGNAEVYENAEVFSEAQVGDETKVFGKACVHGDAKICGKALVDYEVFKGVVGTVKEKGGQQ